MRMADMAPEQRPRERLLAGRGEELGDAELLALLWGSGFRGRSALELAHELLGAHGGLAGLLHLGPVEWAACPGIGPARACQVWAALELSRRAARTGRDRPRLGSPQAVGAHLLPRCQGWTEERFGLLALNGRSELLAERILSQGTATGTHVSPREFYREALRYAAVQAVAFHNHPSGDPGPSEEDRRLTRRLREAGHALGVPLVDHVILGGDRYFSFRVGEGWGG
jgi:DNA repair protein RadC